ncbi:MAG: cysteine hydrolase [Chloroflexi bacterium]|nr:cysteine hydrolase [Chloroflexota bacterium]
MKPALLVIDIQKQFYKISDETTHSLQDAVEYTNEAIKYFRKKQSPVIVIQHMNARNNLLPGNADFDLPDALEIVPGDLHIHKTYGNAFNKTELLEELRKMQVDMVILCGFCAEYCVLSTYHGAKDVDLNPVMLKGGLASTTPRNIAFVEDICEIVSLGALEKFLE